MAVRAAHAAALAPGAGPHPAAYLRAFVESMAVAVVACDAAGRLTMCSPLARKLYRADQRLGEPVEQWASSVDVFAVDGVTPASERVPLGRALTERAAYDVELIVAARDAAPRRVLVSARPVLAADGTAMGALAVLHDVTPAPTDVTFLSDRCRELESANADLKQSVAELEAFAGMVSHDLKNPLATAVGYVQLLTHLAPEKRTSAEYDDYLVSMADGLKGMRTLVNDLLDYATAPGARLQLLPVDLDDLVRDVVAGHVERCRVDSACRPPEITMEPLPPVLADQAMLRRVMDNLIGNAVKYTRFGEPAQVHLSSAHCAEGWAYIEVTDRGIGIPDGRHEAVFEGLNREHGDERYPGNGIGLAFCRRIVERHGGRIGARPNPGGGTRFWLTLPAS